MRPFLAPVLGASLLVILSIFALVYWAGRPTEAEMRRRFQDNLARTGTGWEGVSLMRVENSQGVWVAQARLSMGGQQLDFEASSSGSSGVSASFWFPGQRDGGNRQPPLGLTTYYGGDWHDIRQSATTPQMAWFIPRGRELGSVLQETLGR